MACRKSVVVAYYFIGDVPHGSKRLHHSLLLSKRLKWASQYPAGPPQQYKTKAKRDNKCFKLLAFTSNIQEHFGSLL